MLQYYHPLVLPKNGKRFARSKPDALAKFYFVMAPNHDEFEKRFTTAKSNRFSFIEIDEVELNLLSQFTAGGLDFNGTAKKIKNFSEAIYIKEYLEIDLYMVANAFIYIPVSKTNKVWLKQKVIKK